jgi:hypothetical protein
MLDPVILLCADGQIPPAGLFKTARKSSTKSQNNSTNCQTWPIIVSLDRPRSSEGLDRRRTLCRSRTSGREPPRPYFQRVVGSRASGLLSVVGRYPWSGYVAAGRHRPTCMDFPAGSHQRAKGKTAGAPAMSVAVGNVPKRRRKCMQVGRVARRARPVMWRHIGTVRLAEDGCPALP